MLRHIWTVSYTHLDVYKRQTMVMQILPQHILSKGKDADHGSLFHIPALFQFYCFPYCLKPVSYTHLFRRADASESLKHRMNWH